MRTHLKNEFVVACVAGIILFSTPLFAAKPKLNSADQPPAVEPRFKAGDTLAIAAENADLMLGDQVIAAMGKGQRIIVVEVRDSWIGTHVVLQGEKKAGWIRMHDLLPPALAGQREGSTVAQSNETTHRVYRCTHAEQEHRDAFLIGKYDRHETDPNVHVWEPWRQ
jgi:hypothetical protein